MAFGTLQTLVGQADEARLVIEERAGPLQLGDGQVSRVTKVVCGRYSVPIEDPKFREGLLALLKPMQLHGSALCFCWGQPTVEFLREKKVILTLMVKHDTVVEIDTGKGPEFVSGYEGLAEKYSAFLRPYIPKREGREEAFSVAAKHKSEIDEAREALKKDVMQTEQELQDSFRNLEVEITPPHMEIPRKK